MTFIIPMVVGMLFVLVGLTQPELPRNIFIYGFLFALVILPGILIALKIFTSPTTRAEVVLAGIEPGGNVSLRFPDQSVRSYQAPALNRDVMMGKVREGERMKVLVKGEIVFKWERVSHDVDYWPE
ncbi:MAG: hypothetical protein C4575_08805 [Desulforudis sp.]|jgi:hypothetical protein|nr:MAG: hypothetical protein C4575_08805 [Desulforudis sp.]